jgi:anaerobic selenocysteine-containing dehydrogenase
VLVWQSNNGYSKWHGYLPLGEQGNSKKDFENNDRHLEIPLYFAYEDYFMEAYGGFQKAPSNPSSVLDGLSFCMTSTHSPYRGNSTLNENPLIREITHRVPGLDDKNRFKPANDWNKYAVPTTISPAVGAPTTLSQLNIAINDDGSVDPQNKEIASYNELWINKSDADELGINDGSLLQVENPIGAVRCVARVSYRSSRGHVVLPNGAWYDPRPIANSYNHDFVDVGGCPNTLMASQPSRYDVGDPQNSAFVKIVKISD